MKLIKAARGTKDIFGEDQYGTKESTASKAYSTALKNYNSLIRTLLSCMPQKTSDDVDDGFEAFVGTLKK